MDLARTHGSARIAGILVSALAAGLAALGVAGCAADAYPPTVSGYSTIYVDDAPPNIALYPHVWYGGAYAYLVGNTWYYPSRNRWVVLKQEPPELYRHRARYVERVPPAPYGPVYRPLPARQYAPPVEYGYPPPALRVR
jgi:hypothetical protein